MVDNGYFSARSSTSPLLLGRASGAGGLQSGFTWKEKQTGKEFVSLDGMPVRTNSTYPNGEPYIQARVIEKNQCRADEEVMAIRECRSSATWDCARPTTMVRRR